MTGNARVPQLRLAGGDDHPDRTARLLRAYDVMGALVRIVWPTGSARVNWEGAIVSMHESDGHLTVTWRDEESDYEQFDSRGSRLDRGRRGRHERNSRECRSRRCKGAETRLRVLNP